MTTAIVVALLFTVFVGISLGMLGSGGGMLLLPILVYIGGIDAHRAVVMSLAIVCAVSGTGALLHSRHAQVHGHALKRMAIPGLLGAALGSQLTHLLAPHLLMLGFGLLMLAASLSMLRRQAASGDDRSTQCWMSIGFSVGVLTGLLGVGGGFIIMPSLVLFAGMDMKRAVGTSLAVIAINSAAGLTGHLTYVDLQWPLTGLLLTAALVGLFIGTSVCNRLASRVLRNVLAGLLMAIAMVIITTNGTAIASEALVQARSPSRDKAIKNSRVLPAPRDSKNSARSAQRFTDSHHVADSGAEYLGEPTARRHMVHP